MDKRKQKHGTFAVAISAAVLAGVILFNVVFALLAKKYVWTIDTTQSDLIAISDYSHELLAGIDKNQNQYTIYFLADPDELENYELWGHVTGENNSTWGMSYIYNLAKLYEKEFPFIKVKQLDMNEDADYIRDNFTLTIGSVISPLTVVIENRSNGLKNYRTYNRDDFFTISNDVMYFRGDDRFTSSILSLSGDNPVAYFVEGHGENVGPAGDEENFADASRFAELFAELGYVVKKIDLSEEDFPAEDDSDSIGGAAVVVLYGPKNDFTGEEVNRLREFVNRKNNNLMVFMDPGVDDTPVLDEYLEDFWGVGFEDNIVIADTSDPATSSALTEDGKTFYADYELKETSPGSALVSSFTNLESLPGAFFSAARTIAMNSVWSDESESNYVPEMSTSYKLGAVYKAPVLSSAEFSDGSAVCFDDDIYDEYVSLYYDEKYEQMYSQYYDSQYEKVYEEYYDSNVEDFTEDGLSSEEIEEKCREYALGYIEDMTESFMDSYISLMKSDTLPVMTLTHGSWMYEVSESVSCYMLACGSTSFASNAALSNSAYSNRDTLYSAIYLFGRNILPFDIDIVKIDNPYSLSVPDSDVIGWTVFLCGLLPAAAVAAGVIVVVRRRKHN